MTDVMPHADCEQYPLVESPVPRPVPLVVHHAPRLGHAPTIGMILPVRIFLAAGWLRAGAEKLVDHPWWNGSVLRTFLKKQHDVALPFFRPVMQHLIAPGAGIVALTVMVTQLLCGVCIALGRHMQLALRLAFFMNVTFILVGRVNPSAFYLVMELLLLFALADGALGSKTSRPNGRTFIVAGVAVALAGSMTPFVRTIEPAKVIDDPAMMLVFLELVVATTLMVRYASYPHCRHTVLGRLWTWRLANWVHAKPRTTPPWSPPHIPRFAGRVPHPGVTRGRIPAR